MQNGDLSNDLVKRVLVSVDIVRKQTLSQKKLLKLIPVTDVTYTYDLAMLSRLYLFADRYSMTLELISFDMDRDELQKIVEELDEIGTSPFRYFTAYESTQHLVAELPYRREVAGVLDTPDKLLMYGSWGMDFSLL